ncbi:MAG: porin family protein [Moraxellaceae bacterium]
MLKKLVVAMVLAMPTLALAQQGLYFSVGAAAGKTDLSDLENPGSVIDDEVQRVVIGGGYQFNENLALEAVYLSNAENTVETGPLMQTLDHDGIQLSVLAYVPFTAQFSAFGKVSTNYLNVAYQDNAGFSLDDSGMHLGVGAGLAYQVSDQLGLRATYERLMITDVGSSSGDFDVDQVALVLNYSF